jgi:quinol monooxygenase YgiN
MPEHVHVVAHFHFRPGTGEAARKIFETAVLQTRSEPGCLSYDFYVNVDDPNDITFIEEWSSAGSLEAHLASAHVARAQAEAAPLLDAEPRILKYARPS